MSCDVFGIILAAGQSRRMEGANKLTQNWQGKPLVRHVVDATLRSRLSKVFVVTGHEAGPVARQLPDNMILVQNPSYAEGMATSVRAGVNFVMQQPHQPDGIMIMLGDMPLISASHINQMIKQFETESCQHIVRAVDQGRPRNPVLFPKILFGDLLSISADQGARDIIKANAKMTIDVELGAPASRDFDTPDAFKI